MAGANRWRSTRCWAPPHRPADRHRPDPRGGIGFDEKEEPAVWDLSRKASPTSLSALRRRGERRPQTPASSSPPPKADLRCRRSPATQAAGFRSSAWRLSSLARSCYNRLSGRGRRWRGDDRSRGHPLAGVERPLASTSSTMDWGALRFEHGLQSQPDRGDEYEARGAAPHRERSVGDPRSLAGGPRRRDGRRRRRIFELRLGHEHRLGRRIVVGGATTTTVAVAPTLLRSERDCLHVRVRRAGAG